MNLLDVVILLVAAGAGYAGYRYGFTSRALSWAGLVAGIVIGVLFVDDIANALRSSTPRTRLIGALAFLFLAAVIGQSLGIAGGVLVRRHLPARAALVTADRVAGSIAGVLSVLIGVWLLIPAFASSAGWPARAVRGSVVVRAVDRWAPKPPDSLATLGRLVGEAPFPQVFERLTAPDAGTPPGHGLSPRVTVRVANEVVKVEGRACDEIQQGSGFVAAPDVVVTNAHVVGGERATAVLTPDGRRLDATVVGFDAERDLAALRVRGLGLPSLPRAAPQVDSSGAVIGYPGGGPQRESPARIAEQIVAKGTDIYRSSPTQRDVLVLAASLAPGDSGGPLFDARGRVVGVAFAVDPGNSTTAYALTRGEVERGLAQFLASGRTSAVATGPCLVG